MKRLLTLLFLLAPPAYGQSYIGVNVNAYPSVGGTFMLDVANENLSLFATGGALIVDRAQSTQSFKVISTGSGPFVNVGAYYGGSTWRIGGGIGFSRATGKNLLGEPIEEDAKVEFVGGLQCRFNRFALIGEYNTVRGFGGGLLYRL